MMVAEDAELIKILLSAVVGGGVTAVGSFLTMRVQIAVIKNDINHIYHELGRLRK